MEPVELSRITDALQRIDPVWDLLYPEEQHRVLQLLIEQIRVFQDRIEVRFRCNGIEQIVEELPHADVAEPFATNQLRRQSSPAKPAHPAVTICREDGAVVVHIPVYFCRRTGRQMILNFDGQQHPARQDQAVNSALVSASCSRASISTSSSNGRTGWSRRQSECRLVSC